MNILYLADIRFPLERANGIQTMETCAALAARDHRVTLFVRPDTTRPRRDPWAFYGVRPDERLTIEQPAWLGMQGPQAFRRLLYLRAALKRAQTAPPPDVVFTRDLGVADLLIRRRDRAGGRGKAPVVYESHGYAPEVSRSMPTLLSNGAKPDDRKLRRLEARERRVWEKADGYVTITSALAQDLIARFSQRGTMATIPDGVRIPREAPKAPVEPWAPVVGYAGHLYPWKGVDILIYALRELPGVRGLIVGGHAAEPDLARTQEVATQAGVADRIEFAGFVQPSEVAAQLARADVLVLPNTAQTISARYTSPLKLFEYMAAGRPIVASDLPAIREIIQDGRNGLLVPPGDALALASAIRRLVDDRGLAARLAKTALNESRLYTWDQRARRLEQIFSAVLR